MSVNVNESTSRSDQEDGATSKPASIVHPKILLFRLKKVAHPKAKACLNRLILLLETARPESIIVLIGPSGSGKSTLMDRLRRHLAQIYAERMAADPGFLPYVSVEAVTALDGAFNWKDGLTRTLVEAGEVLINKKAISRFEVDLDGEKLTQLRTLVRDELRRALENLFRHRDVPVLMIDEASAILMGRKGVLPLLQFEVLKSLAVRLKKPIVLTGAYDLLGILDGTGQLVRRSDVVHLSRYNQLGTTEDFVEGKLVEVDDLQHFRNALHTLLEAMDVDKEVDFTQYSEYFMMKSVGCVGNLKDWLERAYAMTLETEDEVLTLQIVRKAEATNKTLVKLTSEAKVGEERLKDLPDDDLAAMQGWAELPLLPKFAAPADAASLPAKPRKPKKYVRPGTRGPSRDPVGGLNG
jgi:GTPase SAR1 family protein